MGLPAIAIYVGVQIGLWAIDRYLLRDEEPKLPKPKPEGLEFANNTVGTSQPYIAGTVRVDNPNLIWHGNYRAIRNGSAGFVYKVDLLLVLGTPIWDEATSPWSSWRTARPPRARKMWYGDKQFTFNTPLLHDSERLIAISVDDAGLVGYVEFFDGRAAQTLVGSKTHEALTNAGATAAHIPGYRHKMLFSLLTSSGAIGTNPRVPAIGVEVSAIGPEPPGTNGIDANPAWILYDIMCRPVWGLGVDPDDVDLASFEAAADTLVTEGHGCSVVIHRPEEAAKILLDVLSQIDAVMYLAPSTGKVKLKLIRADYDAGTIPHLTVDNVLGGDDRPELDHTHERFTVNEVRVHFTDRSRGYKPNTATAQKLANAAVRDNRRRPLDFHAPGCMTAELAGKIAARELAIHGRPLMTLRATVNREFYDLELGDAVKVTLAQYNLAAKVFRVLEVDTGQRADGAIRLMLVEDVFGVIAGGLPVPEADPPLTIYPITERYFDEAPRQMMYLAALAGAIPALGSQSLMGCAVQEDDDSTHFSAPTKAGGPGGVYAHGEFADIPMQVFPTTCTVATAYPRTLEPYDTSTGMVVENVAGELASTFATLGASASEIINQGENLFVVGGSPDQVGEIIAFESVTDLGGGQYRLVNVWRGLLDTVPVDHAVGARLYHLRVDAVGRRDWITDQYARAMFATLSSASGDPAPSDLLITPVGRRFLPMRAADLRASGYDLDGTSGVPAVDETYPLLGGYKALSRLEGALDLDGRENRIDAGKIVRGDDASWTADSGTTWDVYAQKVGEDEVAIDGHADLATPASAGILLGKAGHGAIDVLLHSKLSIGGASRRAWQSPAIRCTAPTWRDLLANGSADYGALSPGWTDYEGTATVTTGTSSLPREAVRSWFATATANDSGRTTIRQTVDVSGYLPGGLTALVTWYGRNFSADADDYSYVKLEELTAAGASVGSTTSSNIVGPTTHWRRATVSRVLGNTAAQLRVEVSMASAGGGDLTPNTGVTGIRLQLGQMSSELLANPSFDGALTSWTNVTNSFVVNTTNPYASDDGTIGAAQGGAFASSEIKQEVAIPAGYTYGVALLSGARSNSIADDTGEVVLEVLDVGNAVIEDATTGATTYVVDEWGRFRLAVQLPDAAVTLRVRLVATRALGAGDCGACFDDLSLRVHKDLDPVTTYDFDFTDPVWKPAPNTWQRFHLAFPDQPVPIMAWSGSITTPTVQPRAELVGPTHAWSDGGSPDAASFVGHWDVGMDDDEADDALEHVLSTEAYQFTRAVAASAVDLQASGVADVTSDEYGAFALDEDFAVAVLFRTDEHAWSTAAGLVGRRSNAGIGWGLRLTAAGLLEVVMQGADGSASVTGSTSLADKAPHWAFLVHDAATTTLKLYDDRGGATSVSTATIGALTAANVPLRIGRDGPASATGGVQIARVFIWDEALSAADVAEIAQTAEVPGGLLGGYTLDEPVWIEGPEVAGAATLVRVPTDTAPIAYAGTSYGLATVSANTNKIPSGDFSDAGYWNAEGGVTLTQGLADPTGLARGVRVTNASADSGIALAPITMGIGTPLAVTFWARTTDGVARTLAIYLLDTVPNVIDSDTVSVSGSWQRYRISLGPWANTTPTATLRFVLASSVLGSFDLGHVMWAGFGADVPLAIQDAGVALGDGHGELVAALPVQLNHEGELYVEGTGSTTSTTSGQTLVSIDNDTDEADKRAIVTASDVPRFTLWDSAAAATNTDALAITWSQGFMVRARWNTLELPESPGEQVGIVVADSSADDTTYAALAYAVGATGLAAIRIGGGGMGSTVSPNAVLHRVIVRAREPKLPG